ncbi:MAG: CAP domain-containing protein [Phototrophicaceae bacterium]
MTRVRISVLCLFALCFWASTIHAQDESDLLGRINSLRASLGLAGYARNGALDAAAANQARWMVSSGQVSHTQSDGSTPRTRAVAAGYVSDWVSENIYGGTSANPDVAWNFWMNSSIHYRGITNPNYQDVGIGVARGNWGAAYVLVFGNSSGAWGNSASANTSNNGATAAGSGGLAPSVAPNYVVGWDAAGNIMHEVQPGDTLGDIALRYGYTWDDLPYMLEINAISAEQGRNDLTVGSVFLVPPYDGTYTPAPPMVTEVPPSTPTPIASATPDFSPIAGAVGQVFGQVDDVIGQAVNALPTATATVETVTITPTATITSSPTEGVTMVSSSSSPERVIVTNTGTNRWLWVAVGTQMLLIGGAVIEMFRRRGR